MSNIEVLKDLQDRELLKPLVMGGIVPSKVLTYMEMFYHVDAQVKTGTKRRIAICMTAAKLNISPTTVYNALKSLK